MMTIWKHRKTVLKVVLFLIIAYLLWKYVSPILAVFVTFLLGGNEIGKKQKEMIEIEKRELEDFKERAKKNEEEAKKLEKEMEEFLEELRRWQ